MRRDEYATLVRESVSYPGNIGDSCADTCRAIVLGALGLNIESFFTPAGFLRHPTAPAADEVGDNWREPDFTGDQFVPLVMASYLLGKPQSTFEESRWRIKGSGKLLTPAAWFLVRQNYWAFNFCNVMQGWIFKLPFRWSDKDNAFRENEDSSADYLNYEVAYDFLKRANGEATLNVPKEKILKKISDYFASEVNSAWLVDLFASAIRTVA